MKKILATFVFAMLVTVTFAVNKNLQNDITMVSYEQRWLDSEGTLALKNNSKEEVRNVNFRITYLDMNDKELDYEEFLHDVIIAPGMTKKIDIPAYEYERSYHYYKSEGRPGGSPAFKIKFEIKDYNLEGVVADEESEEMISEEGVYKEGFLDSITKGSEAVLAVIFGILLFMLIIGIAVGFYVLVAVMAKKRNRSVVLWILVSVIASPLLAIIILLVVGKDNGQYDHHAYRPDDDKEKLS